jgi:xanthine dehydrogenase accessory factor
MNAPGSLILLRGGGDLASGVALRLQRAHYKVVITEVAQPLAVRRAVSFAEAIYQGIWEIEGVVAEYLADEKNIKQTLEKGHIPVVVDPAVTIRNQLAPSAIIDGRMLKRPSELKLNAAPFVIGLGPGFTVGEDCHTGIPDTVAGYDVQRVIRAPVSGIVRDGLPIGSLLVAGDQIAYVGEVRVTAKFDGALRGLLHDGLEVEEGLKIGDLDPRSEREYCFTVSNGNIASRFRIKRWR